MDVLINVKSSHNISKWQMGFNLAFKGLTTRLKSKNFSISVVMKQAGVATLFSRVVSSKIKRTVFGSKGQGDL
jgi:hypothetical protein